MTTQDSEINGTSNMPGHLTNDEHPEAPGNASDHVARDGSQGDVVMSDGEFSGQVESVKQRLIECTKGYGVPQLERLYSRVMKGAVAIKGIEEDHKAFILRFLLSFVEDEGNF